MKSDAELLAELERLKAEAPLLMDKQVNSPEVTAWTQKVLAIKGQLSRKVH
jgi:hypothetical protein